MDLWAGHYSAKHRHLRSSIECTSELPTSGKEEEKINPPPPSPIGCHVGVNHLELPGCVGMCEGRVDPAGIPHSGSRNPKWKKQR